MQQIPGAAPATYPNAPRYLGLALIFCGIASLVIALWEYNWTLRYLWSKDYLPIAGMEKERHRSPTVAIIVVLMVVGLFAFFSVFLRLF
jgi:putative membrane protein